MMKKTYIVPTLDVVELNYSSPILAGSAKSYRGIVFDTLPDEGTVDPVDEDMEDDDEIL